MALTDFVQSSISISNATSPTVQGLNTGLLACYHNVYPDRVRVYSVATMLTQMVTDGFAVTSPAYKMASAYCAAPNAPALCCIGRRALQTYQTLTLTCTDGSVGDAYAFTIVGSDGVSHALAYTNVINPGAGITGSSLTGTATVTNQSSTVTFSSAQTLAAGTLLTFSSQAGASYTVLTATTASTTATLSALYTGTSSAAATIALAGTSAVTNGSTAVTFSVAQTLPIGTLLMFGSQPGTYYTLSAAVTSSTSGTLSSAYQGTTAAAAATASYAPLAGTFGVTNGSSTVTTTASQVGTVAVGDSVQFASQPNQFYPVAAVTTTTLTLVTSYTGTTNASTYGADVCQVSTAATRLQSLLSALSNIGTPSVSGAVITISRTDGKLNDIQGWVANGFHNINVQDITADPGIVTDLTAMAAANSGAYYGIALDSNSAAELSAAAVYVEATGIGGKILFGNTSDYGNTQTSVTNDIFSTLSGLSLKRSFIQQNNSQVLCYAGAAAMGQLLALNPGSYTAAYKSLPGVPADSDTTLTESQALVINTMTASVPGPGGKKGNYYKTVSGQNWMWPGCAPSGQFIDITIGVDWLALHIQQAVAGVLSGLPKVPFTQFGLGLIGNAIGGVLRLGSTAAYNLIVPDGQDPLRPISVVVPTASSLTPAQRASRDVTGFSWSAGLQGAIQNAVVTGTLLP